MQNPKVRILPLLLLAIAYAPGKYTAVTESCPKADVTLCNLVSNVTCTCNRQCRLDQHVIPVAFDSVSMPCA